MSSFPPVLLKKGVKLDWLTPIWFFNELDVVHHFMLDAATCKHNPLSTQFFWTKEEDGLEKRWIDPTFANPPYSAKNIKMWLKKAQFEQSQGVTSVFLLPARTGTSWFHTFCYNKPNVWIKFVKGRLKFGFCRECYPDEEYKENTAPFDSLLVTFFKKHQVKG